MAMCLKVFSTRPKLARRLAGHDAAGDLGDGLADDLGDEGHGAAGARIDFEQVDDAVLERVLHVHQAADLEGEGEFGGLALELGDDLGGEVLRGQRAGAVAGVDAGFLDMLHDAADEDVLAVAEAIDVDFDGVGEVAVEQQRIVGEDRIDLAGLVVGVAHQDIGRHEAGQGVLDVALEIGGAVDDGHGAAAQHVGRADDQRIAQALGDEASLLERIGDAVLGLGQFELVEELGEQVAVFGQIDGVGLGAEDRHAGLLHGFGQVQRGLAAELDDDAVQRAVLLFGFEDLDDVFFGQRLEIEAIGGVVVGRDGFGIAVDHDGFIAGFAEREGGMAAAIVELDALADAVGTAAEDDDLLAVGGARLVGARRRRRAAS